MPLSAEQIQINYLRIQEKIHQTALKCGRKPDEIRIVVVTKSQPLEVIKAAIEAGIRSFGENYPEEAVGKINAIRDVEGVEWHMIGHLQSRKAKLVSTYFDWMHSLDSVRIAEKLERLLAEQNRSLKVLLEFNIGGEISKYGWSASNPSRWFELLPEIEQIQRCPHLQICGLMTMPPLSTTLEEAQGYFRKLRLLRDFLQERLSSLNLTELSMGTSADFPAAILEGATMVRIGQAILGPRDYSRG
ncbi:MAG: YggS family pyridoxal phosphate-dependent enzyme [Chloroflexota bacterium]|nr:MAG: YggS family pyridoxal phosphate enzyme [Bellilinea sp.]